MTLTGLDGRLSEEIVDLRWGPLTHVMHGLSSWWMEAPAFILLVLVADARARRLPVAAVVTLLATVAASSLAAVLKTVFDRPRPPLAHVGISALGRLPESYSFPSGHATTAFAAAAAAAAAYPRLRPLVLLLAALVAASRVYLGVHYVGDVLAGAALGTAVGMCIAVAARRCRSGRRRIAGGR